MNPRDFIDYYLIEMKEKKNPNYSHFDITDLMKTMLDMFRASNSSTSNIIRWFLVYMSRFQEIQERIQKEIDKVVPRDSLPTLEHKNKLTYLDATINEVQRHSSMFHSGIVRCATKDVRFEGFDIPKELC
ncbi:hypothetical protein Anas_04905 [Armadillidium nasatum]|uniref:Cytochrome P450 2L1 n=1 Tax=Armadillidium nasatum TaxID=96803 RepID=A0A5N5SNF9_9CRUS|nr:hypothetical protein Anas_04905 [Armadillidium nasatum]